MWNACVKGHGEWNCRVNVQRPTLEWGGGAGSEVTPVPLRPPVTPGPAQCPPRPSTEYNARPEVRRSSARQVNRSSSVIRLLARANQRCAPSRQTDGWGITSVEHQMNACHQEPGR